MGKLFSYSLIYGLNIENGESKTLLKSEWEDFIYLLISQVVMGFIFLVIVILLDLRLVNAFKGSDGALRTKDRT